MEEAYIYSNHSKIHKSSVATSNPNKNGFSSPLSWRAQACKMEKWKRKRYKEEDGAVPTSPSTPPSSLNRVARAPKCPRWVSLRENRRKRGHLTHQRKRAPGGRVSPPGASHQTGGKYSRYRPAVTKCRQAGLTVAPVWRLAGAWLAVCSAWRLLCVARRFLLTIFFSLCYSGSLISLDFWNKASRLQKRHKNGD